MTLTFNIGAFCWLVWSWGGGIPQCPSTLWSQWSCWWCAQGNKGWVPGSHSFSPTPTVSPGTWNSRFFNDASPWLTSNIPDHTNYTSSINRWFCNIQYQVSIKHLTQMCQIKPIKNVTSFPKSHHTLTTYMMLTFTTGTSHTSVYSECQGEGILTDLGPWSESSS